MDMKFRAHDTFFIRKGWLSKGMRNVIADKDVFITKDKDRNPMDVLGIGANMVKALRYWLQAVGLTEEPSKGQRFQYLTELGQIIYDQDPYIEEIGTLWLLQYQLAKNKMDATAWYFFFNEFNMVEFTREEFVQSLQNYILMAQEQAAVRSLNDDFSCIISTYVSRGKTSSTRVSPENNIDCPFGELGLIDILRKTGNNVVYKKSIPAAETIDPWIALAVIYEQASGNKEISLSNLLSAPCNIGRVFNLDSITMIEILHKAERTGLLRIVRTAGLDYIKLNEEYTFIDCVKKYYEEIVRYTIYGKHATYIKYLVNDAKAFKRYIDVYMAGAALGALYERRAEQSDSTDRARIYSDAFNTEHVKCNELFRTVILADTTKSWSPEERANICFRYRDKMDENAVPPVTQEEVDIMREALALFNAYVLGGIEILYDSFSSSATISMDETVDYAYKTIFDQHSLIESRSDGDDDDQLLRPEY